MVFETPKTQPTASGLQLPTPTAVPAKNPSECNALVGNGYTYVDVRTPDEYAQGAPVDCVNVQAFSRNADGGDIEPESEVFLKLMAQKFSDKTSKLLLGCASGTRSTAACGWLADAGYTDVINNNEGFVGWKNRGLPYRKAGSNAIY